MKENYIKKVFKDIWIQFRNVKTHRKILVNWIAPTPAKKQLTEKRPIFFGVITSEYLAQIVPVANKDIVWFFESFSAGLAISDAPAATRPLNQLTYS